MFVNEFEMRKLMCEIGKRVYNRGMVAANDGNFSYKIGPNEILCTPTGVSKGFMTPNMICKIDMKGNILQSDGVHKPSSEIKMHLRVYECREDVNSVVHAHPMYATAYAIAGIPLDKQIMPEATIFLGQVPIAPYGLPSTMEIPDAIEPYFATHDAVLLESHGALTWGVDLMAAYFKMEGLEFYAELSYRAQMLGGAKELPAHEVKRLLDLRKAFNVPGKHPCIEIEGLCTKSEGTSCTHDSNCSNRVCAGEDKAPKASKATSNSSQEELIARITREVLNQLKK